MARFVYGYCKVNTGDPNSGFILDPCNCTAYYKIVTSPITGFTKERLNCENEYLWNHHDDECQPRSHILKYKICNERIPWDRCYQLTENNKNKIENKCIKDQFFLPTTGSTYFVNNVHHHLLVRESQLANLELVFASMVAGSVITIVLIALLMTLCNWQYISKRIPGYKSRHLKSKSKGHVSVVTEGDHVSVVYEDVDENEEDAMNSGYKPMATANVWQSTSSGSTTNLVSKQTSNTSTASPIVRPGHRPPVPPSKPASLQVEMSVHNVSKTKSHQTAVSTKKSFNYIHPQ